MDDFKAAFRAATSSRQGGKMTKEQLRSLKAQKAAALAQQAEEAALVRTRSTDEDARSMPPPPPRISAAAAKAQPDASYHADSQATRLNGGGAVADPNLHSEPSVNNRGGRALRTSPDAANAISAVGSSGLPAGFFEASVMGEAAVGSDGGGGGAPSGPAAALSGGARSVEGSTGGVEGGRAANAADLATSALSPAPKARPAASAVFPIREEDEQEDQPAPATSLLDLGSAPAPHGGATGAESAAPGSAALPAGFFSDAAADAVARGVAPKRKAPAELDKEMADFMSEVEADAAAAATAAAAADEEDVDARRDREDFEHFVRMERLRELREAASKRGGSGSIAGSTAGGDANGEGEGEPLASALELAGIQPEAPPPPPISLPKRRKVSDTLAQLERGGGSDSDGASGSDSDGEPVDWRAKRSARR